jgi:hypothetical protein
MSGNRIGTEKKKKFALTFYTNQGRADVTTMSPTGGRRTKSLAMKCREFLSVANSDRVGCTEGQPDDSLFLKATATADCLKEGLVFYFRNRNEISVGRKRFFNYHTTGRRPSQEKLQAFEVIVDRLEANVIDQKPVPRLLQL